MGENLIGFYEKNVKKEWKIAFWSAFILCLLVHLYKFGNTLINHDSLYNVYSPQNIVASGRWFLRYACGISSYFDLPWLNGLLSTLYLALAAGFIAALFDLKNPVVIVLSSAILAASPCTTETFFFSYTADGYMMGLMFSAAAAVLICKTEKLRFWVLGGVLICLATGIYQSCLSFAMLLSAAWLVLELLSERKSVKQAWAWIGKNVLLYGAALAAYYIIWKLALHFYGLAAVSYQGIDNVGRVGFSTIIHGAIDSVANLLLLLIERNFFKYPITPYTLFNLIWMAAFIGILIAALIKSKAVRKASRLLTVLVILGACVPVLSIWEFTSDTVYYRPMMLHGVCVFYILSLILFDRWAKPGKSTVFGLFMAAVVFNFAIVANISYFYMEKSYEKTYYMGSQMMNEIEQLCAEQEEPISSIAILGDRHEAASLVNTYPAAKAQIVVRYLEQDILLDSDHAYLVLENLFGLKLPQATTEQLEALARDPAIQALPAWPNRDCMTIVDNVLVVVMSPLDVQSGNR